MVNHSDDDETISNEHADTTDPCARRGERNRSTTRGRLDRGRTSIPVRRSPADLAPKDHLPFFGKFFMMDFMYSIDCFWASSAPGGRVTVVPVVWDSSLHPHTKHTDASAVGRIRLPIKNDVTLERIWHLSIVVSAGGEGEHLIQESRIGPRSRRARSGQTGSGPGRPLAGSPQLVMTPDFLGGEGAIVERELVDQPDERATVHATRGPGYRLEAPQQEAARFARAGGLGRDRLGRDAVDVEFQPPAAPLGDEVVPAVGDVVPGREEVIATRVPRGPPVQEAEQARGEQRLPIAGRQLDQEQMLVILGGRAGRDQAGERGVADPPGKGPELDRVSRVARRLPEAVHRHALLGLVGTELETTVVVARADEFHGAGCAERRAPATSSATAPSSIASNRQ